ncbi:MAG: hypothetical protein IPO08_05230 [Xanthomonadales bacterium]|nr:hypothetical protein [Xanthomonadales bacterium]
MERIVTRPGAQVEADSIILELINPEVVDLALAAEAELKAAEADYTARQMSLASQALDQRAQHASVERASFRPSSIGAASWPATSSSCAARSRPSAAAG